MNDRNHDSSAGRSRIAPGRVAVYTPIALRDGGPDEAMREGARQPITEAVMRGLSKGCSFQSRHFLEDLTLRQGIDFTAEPCREKKAEVNVP